MLLYSHKSISVKASPVHDRHEWIYEAEIFGTIRVKFYLSLHIALESATQLLKMGNQSGRVFPKKKKQKTTYRFFKQKNELKTDYKTLPQVVQLYIDSAFIALSNT